MKALADADAIVVHVTLPQAERRKARPKRRRARPSRKSSAGASPPRSRRGVIGPECGMKVVVGLGNPGNRMSGRGTTSASTWSMLAASPQAGRFQSRFQAQVRELIEDGEKFLLVKPETFMNLSGRSVRQVVDFYQVPVTDLLVVCDDINLPLGKLRIRAKGTHGGHNGLRDIQNHLGATNTPGCGSASMRRATRPIDHVLGRFRPADGGDRGRGGAGGAGRGCLGEAGRRSVHEQVQRGSQGQGREEP